MKKIFLLIAIIFMFFGIVSCSSDNKNNNTSDMISDTSSLIDTSSIKEDTNMKIVNVYVGDKSLEMVLEDNASSKEFYERLKKQDIIVDMSDYGNFEKVGSLGFSMVTSDKQITTSPGDIILYCGDTLTIYYDRNSWNFTLLGRIQNMTRESMLSFLGGKGEVTVRFSLN